MTLSETTTDVFVSYTEVDKSFAIRLVEELRAHGIAANCAAYFSGAGRTDRIVESLLDSARVVIVLWTAHSKVKDWVYSEAERARSNGTLVSTYLDTYKSIPMPFDVHRPIDLRGWAAESASSDLARLLETLRSFGVDCQVTPFSAPQFSAALLWQYRSSVSSMPAFTHLPPTFGADLPLAMASVYVELTVSQTQIDPAPRRLGGPDALAEAMKQRHRRRLARRISAQDAICGAARRVVVLGEPGSGKSSLLKHAMLQISSRAWTGRSVAFFVGARSYVESRRRWKGARQLSLLRFALSAIVSASASNSGRITISDKYSIGAPPGPELDLRIEALMSYIFNDSIDVVILLDGLDEVATDAEGRTWIADELRSLPSFVSWIATSRRTGFFGGLDEEVRYDIVDLHDEAIGDLVTNWFEHANQGLIGAASRLLDQIISNERLLAMARNPFLLTCLCYLSARDCDPLPVTRVEVYERIFFAARDHLRHRVGDSSRLSPAALDFLGRFCHHLYTDAEGAPRQIFDISDWEAFAELHGHSTPDLNEHYIESRLMDCWTSGQDFHLVHLTLHEYLVSREMARRPVAETLERSFNPAWRVVVRFVGGLLWRAGRVEDFRSLVRAWIDPPDRSGLLYIEAAQVMVEAGISDSTALLGVDLRTLVWKLWEERVPWVEEAAGVAIATLDPAGVLERARRSLAQSSASANGANIYELFAFAATGTDVVIDERGRVLRLVAEIRKREARDLLWTAWLQPDDRVAGFAAEALARQGLFDTPTLVLNYAATLVSGDSGVKRVCAWARHARRLEAIPWLLERLAHDDHASEVLVAIAAIASPHVAAQVIAWIERPRDVRDIERLAFDALSSTRSETARLWLEEQLSGGDELKRSNAIYELVAQFGIPTERILALLAAADQDEVYAIIDAVAARADAGEVFEQPLDDWLLDHLADPLLGERSFEVLVHVACARARSRQFPRHERLMLSVLQNGRPSWRGHAASGLGRTCFAEAVELLMKAADDPQDAARVQAIGALGCFGRSKEISALLAKLAVDEDSRVADAAADALARTDFERLAVLPRRPAVERSLARAVAESGVLLFERYYIDATGGRHALNQNSTPA